MRAIVVAILLATAGYTSTADLRFTLHELKSGRPGPTLLVIGGIQGDEPGGFTAGSLLVTDYRIERGEVWVVPNLNFESIIKRSRGVPSGSVVAVGDSFVIRPIDGIRVNVVGFRKQG